MTENTSGRNGFFVVMRNRSNPNGGLIPFSDDDWCLLTWPTAEAAREALKDHHAVQAWGATIFNFDSGESEEL